ncbi:MAG: TIGR01244 family sulfur transferase [Pseudomonadota bacterium]
MDIRRISDTYAVSPQIEPTDVPEIAAAGFTCVVCNRPDLEIPIELHAQVMRAAVEAAGLMFIDNPIEGRAMTIENVAAQDQALTSADGPVLAYCASGTRSSIVWCLSQAGSMPTADIINAAAEAGYDLSFMAAQLDAFAAQK